MILDRRGRIFVVSIIAATIIVFVALYIGASRQAEILEKDFDINLVDVKVKEVKENEATLTVIFKVNNKSNSVITVGEINYDLFANDKFVCKGSVSYRDIPQVGRPQVFANSQSSPIEVDCQLKSDANMDIWNSILTNNIDDIVWRTKGITELESSFSVIPINFDVWI